MYLYTLLCTLPVQSTPNISLYHHYSIVGGIQSSVMEVGTTLEGNGGEYAL